MVEDKQLDDHDVVLEIEEDGESEKKEESGNDSCSCCGVLFCGPFLWCLLE